MIPVPLAEPALMNAPLKQYLKETSTRSILMYALIVVLALMFAPRNLSILNSKQ